MNNKKINDLFLKFIKLLPLGAIQLSSPQAPPSQIQKILLIKLEGMGDSVYLLEIIHRLSTSYPSLKIDILSTGGNPLFPLFKDLPNNEFGLKILNPLNPISYFKTVKSINKGVF